MLKTKTGRDKKMRTLNQKASKIFNKIVKDINHYKEIKNNDAFMAVKVEKLETFKYKHFDNEITRYSIGHTYKQNGDLVSDPRMEFLKIGESVFPSYYEQHNSPFNRNGLYQESIIIDKELEYFPELQKDHAIFANTWLNNINNQQFK